MLIYLVDGEMLLCMPMEMIIVGPNLQVPNGEMCSYSYSLSLNRRFNGDILLSFFQSNRMPAILSSGHTDSRLESRFREGSLLQRALPRGALIK